VFGNCQLLVAGTPGKQLTDSPRKGFHVQGIKLFTPFGGPFPGSLPGICSGKTFFFRSRQRLFFYENALAFVAFAGATKTVDDRTKSRVAVRTSS
jgi:hypothetical protein